MVAVYIYIYIHLSLLFVYITLKQTNSKHRNAECSIKHTIPVTCVSCITMYFMYTRLFCITISYFATPMYVMHVSRLRYVCRLLCLPVAHNILGKVADRNYT